PLSSLAVSLSVFASAFGGLVWSSYATFYGRRPMYLWGMPLMTLGSFGTAYSAGLPDLLFWRFVQAFGCSGGMSIGAAVIGDIYALEERGTAMGSFFGVRNYALELHLSPAFIIFHYALLVPLAYTIGVRYNITSEALIGACFLPSGVGNFLGAHIAGRLSDVIVKKYRGERRGTWYPEDRLRVTSIGALYLTPLSVSVAGLTMTYIGGPLGLSISLFCLFTNGIGVDMVLTPLGSYIVDLMGARSAEAMAAVGYVILLIPGVIEHMLLSNRALRSLLLAPLSALIIPSINLTGVAVTNGIT
ncbi:hypothetical protein ID866_11964, partial [Astraeus odoratus]